MDSVSRISTYVVCMVLRCKNYAYFDHNSIMFWFNAVGAKGIKKKGENL
jgi:hypothetical protein